MLKDKIKGLLAKKEDEPDKKKLENLVVFVIILIITIIIINFIWNGNSQDNETNTQTTDTNKKLATDSENQNSSAEITETNNTNNTVVKELEDILSNINGVGKVKIMITYSETSKTIPVYNEESSQQDTEETDSEGGTRKITQTDTKKEVIYEENGDKKTLITQNVISPKVEGAIITAEGAGDVTVKTNIIQAVSAVTGLSTHKIQVFEMSH